MASDEKTERPTPRKLRRARERGEVWRSPDLTSAAVLLALGGVLAWQGPAMARELGLLARTLIVAACSPSPPSPALALQAAFATTTTCLAPVMAAAVLAAVASALATVGPLLSAEPLKPRLDRLSPVAGLRRMLSPQGLLAAVLASAKVAAVGAVAVLTIAAELPSLLAVGQAGPAAMTSTLARLGGSLIVRGGLVLLGLALVDVLYQRHRYLKERWMTKSELRQEHRETEGDQSQKGERRRLHAEILERAMLEQVRSADVVIVNPEHIAVALRYGAEGEDDAPRVVARGEELVARRIVEIARKHGVPVMRDVELARSLATLEVGEQIPEELYEAVAAILRLVTEHGKRP